MPDQLPSFDALPSAVVQFLNNLRDDLRHRRVDRVRLSPLIFRVPLATLIARRKRIFDFVSYDSRDYGIEATFKRHLKKIKKEPAGARLPRSL